MKVKQAADLLNKVFGTIGPDGKITPGEMMGGALVEDDLSNIVDVGRSIISSTAWGDNFDNYVKAIIDKVGKVVFVDRVYRSTAPNVRKDAWQYGSILEKVRCDVADYTENKEWELSTDYNPDGIFKFTPPTVKAKYFNNKSTFQIKLSITRKQAEEAFRSASDMNRFIAMIENRVSLKMGVAIDALIYRTIANFVAEKISANKGVIDLLGDYNTAAGAALTAEQALRDREFLRYASKTISMYKGFMSRPSALYNDGSYITFTPEDRLHVLFLTDFAKAMETSLYSDTFHNEFVKLSGYEEVPYWQGTGTANSFKDRASLHVKIASDSSVVDTKTNDNGYIVATMFDDEAVMVCNEEPDTRSIYNPEGNFYNFWHTFDASYFNDLAENGVVFVLKG